MELSITVILIIITCLSSYYAWKNPVILDKWMFSPYIIRENREWIRFILSGFIHKDGIHLLFNMFTFFFFGGVVEQYLYYKLGMTAGGVTFVGFYIAAIIIADIPTYFKEKNNPNYHALGASGGTAATVFASIILMPLAYICIFGIFCLPGFILGLLFLGYSFYQSKKSGDNINHDAHLYGALFGIVFIIFLSPENALHFIEQIKSYQIFK